MLTVTTWKSRPISPEQTTRMMAAWAASEQMLAEDANIERLGWYLAVDGSGGLTITRHLDGDLSKLLTTTLMMGEFLEFEVKHVLDLDGAMPAITAAMAHINP